MITRLLFTAFVPLVLLTSACADRENAPPTRADCLAIRDHVVDLQLGPAATQLGPDNPEAAAMAAHREQLRAAGSDEFVDHCLRTRTHAYVACAKASTSLDQLASCDPR